MNRDHFIPSAVARAQDLLKKPTAPWLNDYREAQVALLKKARFPTPKTEHFKYNRLESLFTGDFFEQVTHAPQEPSTAVPLIKQLDTDSTIDRVVFVDGVFSPSLSQIAHHHITPFVSLDASQQKKVLAMLKREDLQHNPFMLLHSALCEQGVLVEVDENSPDILIETIMVNGSDSGNTRSTQVLFDIADNATATAISRSVSWPLMQEKGQEKMTLTTTRSIANIGEGAHFTHYDLQLEGTHSQHFGSIAYHLHKKAKLNAFHVATGSQLKKIDIQVNHLGEHSIANLDGLYVANDNQQVDYHTTVNHPLPKGTTNENFRGILNDSAEGVFNGRIHIGEGAQKTLAELSNKNLLISEGATIHTKPELEIYADDVVCAHGATVSRIDDDAMYYLQTRGVDKNEAEFMLSLAFIDELLNNLPLQAIADYIRPLLFQRVNAHHSDEGDHHALGK